MNYHQSNVFLQDLSNSFHCWFNLSILHGSGVPQQFMVVFLIVILNIWRPKKNFSWFLVRSLEDSWFLLVAILLIVSNRVILFLPIRSISELFSFLVHPKAIISEDFFDLSFQIRSPIILNWCLFVPLHISPGASFKYPLVSSWSIRSHVSNFPRVFSRVL